MHDLTRAKLILDADLHAVLARAKDRNAAREALCLRIADEVATLREAVAQAPREKARLEAALGVQQEQLAKLSGIIEGAKHKGRPDLVTAAQERRETLSMKQGVTRMSLEGFDVLVAESQTTIRALEQRAYALNLKTAETAEGDGPSAPAVDVDRVEAGSAAVVGEPVAVEDVASPTATPRLEAAADMAPPIAPQVPAPSPTPAVAAALASSPPSTDDSATASPGAADASADSAATAESAAPQASADSAQPQEALDAEFAALMAAMGEEDAQASAVPASDDADLDSIMAGLTLDEVGAGDLPDGAAAELAREDAEIAEAAKRAGVAPPIEASVPAVVAVKTTAPPAVTEQAGSPADEEGGGPPGEVAVKPRRVWPWVIGAGALGGGGYAGWVYVWPLLM